MRLLSSTLCIILLIVLGSAWARAETVDPVTLGRPALRIFTDRDGLPQNAITAIAFDEKGYLWVGTMDGAACYNGRNWRVVNTPDRRASNYISSLRAAKDGGLWVGTYGGGLYRFKEGKWLAGDPRSGLAEDRVNDVLETVDANGSPILFVATMRGLVERRGEAWRRIGPPDGLPSERILCLAETVGADGRRRVWAGTEAGLACLENGGWRAVPFTSPTVEVTCLLSVPRPEGPTLWCGTRAGLWKLDRERWAEVPGDPRLPGNRAISKMVETREANGNSVLWLGTTNGLFRIENGVWRMFSTRHGLPVNGVWSLAAQPGPGGTRTLWVGSSGGGVVRWQQGAWTSFDRLQGLPDPSTYSLLETVGPEGASTVWIGTNTGGVTRIADGQVTVFQSSDGLPSNSVYALTATASERGGTTIWAGTTLGTATFEAGRWRTVTRGYQVNCLLPTVDDAGKTVLWEGANDGLRRLVDGRAERVDWNLATTEVTSLLETRSAAGGRTLWVGTRAGLARLENGRWTVDTISSGLANNWVLGVREVVLPGGARTLWVGTRNGVSIRDLSRDGWTTLSETTVPALPNNTVYQILSDRSGRLYLCTNKGIARLSPRSPEANDLRDYAVNVFMVADGLPSNECNRGASMIDRRGRLWVGTINGVAVFDPTAEITDAEPKPLQLERSTVNGAARILPENTTLNYDENSVTFEFSLLSFFREEETRYQTHLVGAEREPSEWKAEPFVTYSNLPAGTYTFIVRARDYAGTVTQPVVRTFTIQPSPWRTWWAYASYVLAIAGIGYQVARWRTRALRGLNIQLEAKIADRTAELAEKVALLEVSERRAVQSEHKALDANRAKSIFLANMSHELRTPLNGILGFVQLMERDEALTPRQREHLAIIMRSGEHLLGLINDVLSISKIEAGQSLLHQEVFDLRRLLQGIEEMFRIRAQSRKLTLAVEIAPEVPKFVLGDENKLRQILLNLLSNAFKFTDAGGVSMNVTWSAGKAMFSVADTGFGIAADEMDKLFTPFGQTESGRRSQEGTGLGLLISRNFIRLMDGDIRVESTLGKGTTITFDITLPAVDQTLTKAQPSRIVGLEPDQPAYRILVVDDIWENRVLITSILKLVGFDFREATNGREAVTAWREWNPHLIWMDIVMPVMDGYAATREIRRQEVLRAQSEEGVGLPRTRTVILAVSASAFEHDRQAILEAGCDDFVAKPFRHATIFDKMGTYLGVRYVYEEVTLKPALETTNGRTTRTGKINKLILLPPDLVGQLHKAAEEGDLARTRAIVTSIEEHDPALAGELNTMIAEFRFEEILELTERL